MKLVNKIINWYGRLKNKKLYHDIIEEIKEIKDKKREELYHEIKREIRDKLYHDIIEEIKEIKLKKKFYNDCKDELYKYIGSLADVVLKDRKFYDAVIRAYSSNPVMVIINDNLFHISYNGSKNKFRINKEDVIFAYYGVRKLGKLVKAKNLVDEYIKKVGYKGVVGVFSPNDKVLYYFDPNGMCRSEEKVQYYFLNMPLLRSKKSEVAIASPAGKDFKSLEEYLNS